MINILHMKICQIKSGRKMYVLLIYILFKKWMVSRKYFTEIVPFQLKKEQGSFFLTILTNGKFQVSKYPVAKSIRYKILPLC